MLGAFCAVTMQKILTLSKKVKDESVTFFEAFKEEPYLTIWFGDTGQVIIDYVVPISVLAAIPIMLLIGIVMERGLIRFFYKRPHAEQILVTFGLSDRSSRDYKSFFWSKSNSNQCPRNCFRLLLQLEVGLDLVIVSFILGGD